MIINKDDVPKMFGIYIASVSVNIGWGGQGGSMQMTLVEDEVNNVVLDKDSNGNPFYGGGVNSPTTGTACYFKYKGFYFGGIFQRWTYKESATGGRTYDIVLESPAKLMDGVQLIIENFNGSTDMFDNVLSQGRSSTNLYAKDAFYGSSCYNVYNLFAFYENPIYGRDFNSGNFGSSGFNSSGMPVLSILVAIENLIRHTPVNNNPWGGPIRFSGQTNGPNLSSSATTYSFNISKLADFYREIGLTNNDLAALRLQGPVKNVNGLIQELAEFHQFDYYYSIQPELGISRLPDNNGGQIPNDLNPTIYLQIANKSVPPKPNKIKEYIQELRNRQDKILMSYNLGKEFADTATQKIVWGGRRSRYLEYSRLPFNAPSSSFVSNPDLYAMAVWGQAVSISKNRPNIIGASGSVYSFPFRAPGMGIFVPGVGMYRCTPFEIRMALEGKESWQFWKTMEVIAKTEPNGYVRLIDAPFTAQQEVTKNILNLLISGVGNSYDLICSNLQRANKAWDIQKNTLCDKIFGAVSAVASNSYKQEYFVLLPAESNLTRYNVYAPDEDFDDTYYMRAWSVASSAFIQFGLYAPSLDASFFDGSGKMQACVGYPFTAGRNGGTPDLSALGSDYALGYNTANGTVISKKGQPDGESFWYIADENATTGQFGVLFKTGCQPREFDAVTTPDFGLTYIAQILLGVNIPPIAYIGSGKQSLQISIPPDVLDPVYFGIPQESQRFNYGPWVTLRQDTNINGVLVRGNYSPDGRAEASEVAQLVPETYGNYWDLLIAGSIYAQVSTATMHESETGTIELAGAPSFNIGERFAGEGPYVSGMDISSDTSGVKTTYKFNTWTPEFGKLAKYNLDRIAKINKSAWARSQKLRSEIERPPFPKFKFEKTDFNMLDKAKSSHVDPTVPNQFIKPTTRVNQGNINSDIQ